MNRKIKGVIFSIGNVLYPKDLEYEYLSEIELLIKFLLYKDLVPVVLANRDVYTHSGEHVESYFDKKVGHFPWFISLRDNTPPKPRAEAMQYVLDKMGWDSSEAVYVGNTNDDMRTAVNGKILFLNACWYPQETQYGITFDSPKEVTRFIDLFCLRNHLWHYEIDENNLRYYALGPYSTFKPNFAGYSEDARSFAKSELGGGRPDFWNKCIWSTIFFSDLYQKIDFVAPYPGHKAGDQTNVIDDPMLAFTKCFRIEYLRNLILRHKTSLKSQTARISNQSLDHLNQLNTIHLNLSPTKGSGKTYNNFSLQGKCVLVVDDFCTQGYSLEAARSYLNQAGAEVICMSWLKTINTNYSRIDIPISFDPYEKNFFESVPPPRNYAYEKYIVDPYAPGEISLIFQDYDSWKWPSALEW